MSGLCLWGLALAGVVVVGLVIRWLVGKDRAARAALAAREADPQEADGATCEWPSTWYNEAGPK